MRDIYLVALQLTGADDETKVASMLVTARQGADENEIGLAAAALLPEGYVNIDSIVVEALSDANIRAIGLIALAKGLI